MATIKNSPQKLRKKRKFDGPQALIIFIACLWALVIIYPFYNAILMSITPYGVYVKQPFMLYPIKLDWSSYQFIFKYNGLLSGFKTTLIVLVVGVLYNLFLTVTLAYGLSKKLPGARLINLFVIFTTFFGGGLIPGYMLVQNLGLIDTYWSMILPYGVSVYNMMIMRSYFRTIPEELGEAARLDGCGEFGILTRIFLPLSKPMLATITLFFSVDRWNEWYNGMLYIRDYNKRPLQLVVKNILGNVNDVVQNIPLEQRPTVFNDGIQMAACIVALMPIAVAYPFLQKHFVAGLTIGGVKG